MYRLLRAVVLALSVTVAAVGCGDDQQQPARPVAPSSRLPDPDAAPAQSDAATVPNAAAAATGAVSQDGQWTMPARDYAGTRFAPLADIDNENVSGLHVAWTFSTGLERGHEAAPLSSATRCTSWPRFQTRSSRST